MEKGRLKNLAELWICSCMQGKSTWTISNLSNWQQILSFHIPVC